MSDNGRLPRNLDAERGVLGAMILDYGIIPEVLDVVRAEDFHHRPHGIVYEAISRLYNQGKPVELNLLANELRTARQLDDAGGLAGLAGLEQFTRDSGAAPELARVVVDKAVLRRLIEAAKRIARDAEEERHPVEIIVEGARRELEKVTDGFTPEGAGRWDDPEEDTARVAERLCAPPEASPLETIRTGLADMDRVLDWRPGEVVVLAARPAVGKTSLALQIAKEAARVGPVLFVCLEMDADALRGKLVCHKAAVPYSDARRGCIDGEQRERILWARDELRALPVRFFDTRRSGTLHVHTIRGEVERAARELGQAPALVALDYLQRIPNAPEVARASTTDQVGFTSRRIKDLARDLPTRVLLLSQLNRDVEKGEARASGRAPRHRLSDLRASGDIEADADAVVFLESPPAEEGASRRLTVRLAKHRNGACGTWAAVFEADLGRMRCLAQESGGG